MPIATVIIAAKNAAMWLPQCVSSVSQQMLPRGWRLRILVGIDACPATLLASTKLKISNLSVRFFPEHVGPYVIFNSLACSAPSDVFVRFDADDLMLDGYLAVQLGLMGSALSPVIVQTWSIYVDAQGRPLQAPLSSGKTTSPDGRRSGGSDGQFLMTRAVWERMGGFRAWWCHADTEFMTRAAWCGIPRWVVPQYLYIRCVHLESLTRSKTTGYGSSIREAYARQIATAIESYSWGNPPERLRPATARCFYKGIIVQGKFVYGR